MFIKTISWKLVLAISLPLIAITGLILLNLQYLFSYELITSHVYLLCILLVVFASCGVILIVAKFKSWFPFRYQRPDELATLAQYKSSKAIKILYGVLIIIGYEYCKQNPQIKAYDALAVLFFCHMALSHIIDPILQRYYFVEGKN